jgi:hypothetical protein
MKKPPQPVKLPQQPPKAAKVIAEPKRRSPRKAGPDGYLVREDRGRGQLRKSTAGKVGINRPSAKGQRLVGEGTNESPKEQQLVGEDTNKSTCTAWAALVKGPQTGEAYHPVLQLPPKPAGKEWTEAELDKWVWFARQGPSLLPLLLQCPS